MKFHIGAILTITDGKFIAPGGIDTVYEILNFLTGDNLFTHQLPRASRECEPYLKEQFPEIAKIVVPSGLNSWEKIEAYFGELEKTHELWYEVEPMPKEAHTVINPLEELAMNYPDKKVIPVVIPEEN